MKISGYKFGHPVFGIDDYYDFRPEIGIEQKIENESLIISSTTFDLGSNNKLKELINDKKASIVTEVFCSYTMYRQCFKSSNGINLSIPLEYLKNKIELLYLIIANETIEDYTNNSIKPELQEQSFYIEEGDLLAMLGEENIQLDVSTSMDSIIKIRESDKDNYTFSWNENSIIINLSSKIYATLLKVKASVEYQKIIVSSILQAALIHACYKLKPEGQYSEKNWHKALLIHWKDFSKQEGEPATEDIPNFVDHLLQKPFELVINTLEGIDHKIRNIQD